MLLAKIVEQVSGKGIDEFAQERIFQPLEMNHTHINTEVTRIVKNRAWGYNYVDEEKGLESGLTFHHRNSPHYGGSGLHTTIQDLGKWNAFFSNCDKIGGTAFCDLMHQTMKFEHDKVDEGMGLVMQTYKGIPFIWYSGGDLGYSSYNLRFPKQDVSIVVLCNIGTGNASSYGIRVADIALKEYFAYPEPILNGKDAFKLKGYEDAETVFLVGDFNDWNKWEYRMTWQVGQWVCNINLPAGKHHYKFVINNRDWIRDPDNPVAEEDKDGFVNSIRVVK